MGSRGPAPKPAATRRNRSTVVGGDVEVEAKLEQRRPLPVGKWHDNARAWWEEASSSPSAVRWVEADWVLVHRALVMVHQWWTLVGEGAVVESLKVHGELVKLEKRLYLSPEDRARGHIEVKPSGGVQRGTAAQVATPVTSIARWQERLGS